MKKAMLLTLAALTLLAPVALAVDDEWGVITIPKGQPIHVGFSAALTGDYANLGLDEQNGVTLALEDKKSEVLGFKVELLVEDMDAKALRRWRLRKNSARIRFSSVLSATCAAQAAFRPPKPLKRTASR